MHASLISRARSLLPAALTLLIFALALSVLDDSLRHLHLRELLDSLREQPIASLLAATAWTAGSYFALTLYDGLALAVAGRPLPYPRVARISFIACALAHSLGLSSLSGGSIRLRAYSAEGLSAADIAVVQGFFSLTFLIGASTLLAGSLVLEPGEAAALMHLPESVLRGLGIGIAAALFVYAIATGRLKRPLRFRDWQVRTPSHRQIASQFIISTADIAFSSAALYVLLPDDLTTGYPAFLGLYVVAITLGAISNVPGGLGVFESALLLMLPGADTESLLGAILLFRLIYYIAPFLLALMLLAWREAHVVRRPLLRATDALRRSVESVLPQALAIAVFAAGALLLASGALPAIGTRIRWLSQILPLGVVEFSHLAGSALGVGLLILARGLYRRLEAAWWLTLLLLGGGILASLLKGIDYEEAGLLTIILLVLASSRERFYRRAPLTEARLSPLWLANIAVVIAAATWLGLVAFRHVDYANELWWQFAFNAHAPRMLRASLVAVLVASGYALWSLLGPARPEPEAPSDADLDAARRCIAIGSDSLANLALLGDKQLLFSEQRDAFIMYRRSGRSWIALGDPVGNAARFPELAWRFRELCDEHGGWCVFYQVTAEKLPLYLDLGLSLSKLGEEARVPLTSFSLEGKPRAELRTAQRKGQREGLQFAVIEPAEVAARLGELEAISSDWLSHKSTAEKSFSVGRFDRNYVCNFPCAIALKDGHVVAFANLWHSGQGGELSVDLMRYGADAPKGVMDYLFVETLLWGKSQGFAWFNLGMAPLSGLEEHPLAPLWHRMGLLVHHYGEPFYNFDGLRRYKEKFHPIWRPRYLASPGGLALPRIMLDTGALIAGGIKEIVWK
jgi:phosphatidylglycerol lysyltransferase